MMGPAWNEEGSMDIGFFTMPSHPPERDLRAFDRAVLSGEPAITDAAHGVANMRVIDAIYTKAGMKLRGLN